MVRAFRGGTPILCLTLTLAAVAGTRPAFAQRRAAVERSALSTTGARTPGPQRARNVILIIGDGMGDSELTVARNYQVGAAGRLAMDRLSYTGAMTTHAVREEQPSAPDYVSDSAAAATAWAVGRKTSNRRVSTLPGTGEAAPTLAELVRAHGMATGNLSTAEVTDATPAALAAHVNDRRCQGPADMGPCVQFQRRHGGPGSIAEQLVDHGFEVLLGGGRQRFTQALDTQTRDGGTLTVLDAARARGYEVVEDVAGLAAAAPDRKVIGLFAAAEMTPEWTGEPATPYPGSGPQRCLEGQRPAQQPGLADMTRIAIDRLQRAQAGKPRGFLLQVEGASIDKMGHLANPCAQIGETVALDAAVAVALDFAAMHPDTLVIVTGDHGHAVQILPPPDDTDHSPGLLSTLLTADGVPMHVSYATTAKSGRYQEHTGTQIRVAATGPRAERVAGVIDNTELFRLILDALGVPPPASGAPRVGAGGVQLPPHATFDAKAEWRS